MDQRSENKQLEYEKFIVHGMLRIVLVVTAKLGKEFRSVQTLFGTLG
jgi:hypothetical protein